MTELLERAVASLHALDPQLQDEIARLVLQWSGEEQPVVELTAEEEASFAVSLAQAERGEFASDEEIAEMWRRCKA